MVYLGYSDELSELNARVMVGSFLKHLSQQAPFSMEHVVIQTDNGVEFSGTTRHFERATFTKLIHSYGAKQRFIPPGCCNANADVESFDDTIEREFFDLTSFLPQEMISCKRSSLIGFSII